jgi:hypothetical protein
MMNQMQSQPMPMGQPQGGPQGFSAPAAGVNLFKVQEQLKDMPQQQIMAYANGSNPDMVPPYIALGEMERRTRMAKNAQTGQPPQGTVKDNLENQIKQTAGIASLGNMRQKQMGQAQAQQAMSTPGAVPGGVPQPQPQGEPPVRMAQGGLASVPINSRMTAYKDGGIVGYAEGGDVEDEEDAEEESGGAPSPVMLASAQLPGAGMGNPMGDYAAARDAITAQIGKRGPAPKSREEIIAALTKSNPEQAAMLQRNVEGEYLKRLEELQGRQGENDTRAQEDLQSRRRMDLWQSLIAAGEGSRGRGIGGLMAGMGQSLGRSSAERTAEEAALRDLPLKRQEIMAKAQYEMQGLQRARAEGDIKAATMHQQNLAKLENEAKKAELGALGRSVGASGNVAGRYMSGEATKEAARIAAAQRLESSKIAAKSREGLAGLRGSGRTPPTPVDIKILQDEYNELVKANAKPPKLSEPEGLREERAARINEIRQELEAFGTTGVRQSKEATVAAPSAGPVKITNDAEYNALASGTVFIGPDNKPRRKP